MIQTAALAVAVVAARASSRQLIQRKSRDKVYQDSGSRDCLDERAAQEAGPILRPKAKIPSAIDHKFSRGVRIGLLSVASVKPCKK